MTPVGLIAIAILVAVGSPTPQDAPRTKAAKRSAKKVRTPSRPKHAPLVPLKVTIAPNTENAAPATRAAATSTQAAVERAIAMTYEANLRGAGIARLTELAESRPAQLALARALSWAKRFDESLDWYGRLIDGAAPEEARVLKSERLKVLLWAGKTDAAETGYESALSEDPKDTDALVGRARALRWKGKPLAARASAEAAVALEPDRREALEELAWTYAEVERATAAEAVLSQKFAMTSELYDRLAELRRPQLVAAGSYWGNSSNLSRLAPRSKATIPLPGDLRLVVGAGATHLEDSSAGVVRDYALAGAGLIWSVGRTRLSLSQAGYYGDGLKHFDLLGRLAIHPIDALTIGIGARHRPFIEVADPLATDERVFQSAGVGGAQLLDRSMLLFVNEASLSVELAPWSWSYLYFDGRGLEMSDSNKGYMISSGLGVNLLQPFDLRALALYAKWEAFLTGYQRVDPAYWSPAQFDVHSVGPELRLRLWKLEVSASGGPTIPLLHSGPIGWFSGGGLRVATRYFVLGSSADYRQDPTYRAWRSWLSIEVHL
jgi:tetratricopeptide (TPR) repeat protein